MPQHGIFLTGIEGSDPVVDGVRRNQLREAHDFYTNYELRLQNIANLGIKWLRFGPPYSQVHLGKDQYDFDFTDKVLAKCQELDITVMADLLHFGLPEWMHAEYTDTPYFQNPHFPTEFAKYVTLFAQRYPHIQYYTPVNEPFVTAQFSSKLGIWNEAKGSSWDDDRHFVVGAKHIAKAAILAKKAIRHVWLAENRDDEPIFIQNESFELARAEAGSNREAEAHRFNLRRFTLLDLMLGHTDDEMREYLLDQGLSTGEYEWFMEHGDTRQTILGIDHYPMCIHVLHADKTVDHDPVKPYRLFELIEEYWERYPLPLLHTEVNGWPDRALALCQETYDILSRLRSEGYPVLGMGWYGDDLQIGWHAAMLGDRGQEETPVGLFYKGDVQPVAELFASLAQQGMSDFDHRDPALRMKKTIEATKN